MEQSQSDALVFFGATGDLAYKKIFPALQAMAKRGRLNIPVIGIARESWSLERLRARAQDSVEKNGGLDPAGFSKLTSLLRFVGGDYTDPGTFQRLCTQLADAKRPAFYLAVPPVLFETVVEGLSKSGCMRAEPRVIVEKPFGNDLASAQRLNAKLHSVLPESSIFRIDHYLGKRPVNNVIVFRFANSFMEPFWNRRYIQSVQMTMAEDFGVEGRGAFYDPTGAIRDVVQNHMFQILSNVAMEPPVRNDSESIRDEKVKVLKAIPPLQPKDVVRGQFRGYLQEQGVAANSKTETYAAIRLDVESWRWKDVPFYIRAGKDLPVNCTEVLARFRKPPAFLPAGSLLQNYIRFRISPEMTIAIGAMVMGDDEGIQGEAVEIVASRHSRPEEMDAYEIVLGDALVGDSTHFARQDYVEQAWRIVDPILKEDTPVYEYEPGSWGPKETDERIVPPGGWNNPTAADQEDFRVSGVPAEVTS